MTIQKNPQVNQQNQEVQQVIQIQEPEVKQETKSTPNPKAQFPSPVELESILRKSKESNVFYYKYSPMFPTTIGVYYLRVIAWHEYKSLINNIQAKAMQQKEPVTQQEMEMAIKESVVRNSLVWPEINSLSGVPNVAIPYGDFESLFKAIEIRCGNVGLDYLLRSTTDL